MTFLKLIIIISVLLIWIILNKAAKAVSLAILSKFKIKIKNENCNEYLIS